MRLRFKRRRFGQVAIASTLAGMLESVRGKALAQGQPQPHSVNADVPNIEVFWVDERDPYVNPLGVKGIGEIGITGTAAAIANAVYHATGKRIRDLPITLDKLL